MNIVKQRYIALFFLALLLSACRGAPFKKTPIQLERNMFRQHKYVAQDVNAFYPDKRSMRMPVKGTVARNELRLNTRYYEGKDKDGNLVKHIPIPVTMQLIKRGQNRFDVFCTPCHGRLGNGDGIVPSLNVGLIHPPNYHQARLINAPDGHFFDVMTNGIRTMMPYRYQIPVHDRWAIVAYIRALQLSQKATKADLGGYTFSDSAIAAYKEQKKEQAEAQQQQQEAMKKAMSSNSGNTKQLIAQGKKLYHSMTCATCHSVDGSKGVGPTWKGLYGSKVQLSDGSTVTADANYITESIMHPAKQVVKGFSPVMPNLSSSLSPQDIKSIIAYIKSLK